MNAHSSQNSTRLFILCLRTCMIRFGIWFFKDFKTGSNLLSLQYQLTTVVRVQSSWYWQRKFCYFIRLILLLQWLRNCKVFNINFCCFILDAVSSRSCCASPTHVDLATEITANSESLTPVSYKWSMATFFLYLVPFLSYSVFSL